MVESVNDPLTPVSRIVETEERELNIFTCIILHDRHRRFVLLGSLPTRSTDRVLNVNYLEIINNIKLLNPSF